jgi:hypothetical protein
MEERPRVRDRSTSASLQMGIAFPTRERILDPRTRSEVVALLGRLLLEAARHGSEGEVGDDAP